MQAFAEDLGAVPRCVPQVLDQLGIPGLRVLRWHRSWDQEGTPYVELGDYPENSMACTSVHDSSMLREWWESEADRRAVWALAHRALGEDLPPRPAPMSLDPDSAALLLRAFVRVGSRIVVFPLQDILSGAPEYREEDPQAERINVPGTSLPSNWTYRMKPYLETLALDRAFAAKAAAWFEAD
jgi:4-alpha-glucanotransferase